MQEPPVIFSYPMLTDNSLKIHLPNGATSESTHMTILNIPWLPPATCSAHIVPGLTHISLISIKALCDKGCTAIYDAKACKIWYVSKVVWEGMREQTTGLWVLPLQPTAKLKQTKDPTHQSMESAHSCHCHFMWPLSVAGENSGRYFLTATAVNPGHDADCLFSIALMRVFFGNLKRHSWRKWGIPLKSLCMR